MAKGTRGRRGITSRQCRPKPYPMPNYDQTEGIHQKNCFKSIAKDWKGARCSVCMECPHNAVLLLCSSHDKGCHPYMCGTSFRYSNCLDQYKNAYSKLASTDNCPLQDSLDDTDLAPPSGMSIKNCDAMELACPLCRGQVKGWTVVEPAREYFNSKKRNCMQDNCSFIGTYKELRKHMRADHPSAKPREVDPALEKKWSRLERERERDDVISTIRSSMPGAVFFGDYVIEGTHYDSDSDDEGFDADATGQNEGFEVGVDRDFMSLFLLLQAFGYPDNGGPYRGVRRNERDSNRSVGRGVQRMNHERTGGAFDSSDPDGDNNDGNEGDGNNDTPLAGHLRHRSGFIVRRTDRRRRRRDPNEDSR